MTTTTDLAIRYNVGIHPQIKSGKIVLLTHSPGKDTIKKEWHVVPPSLGENIDPDFLFEQGHGKSATLYRDTITDLMKELSSDIDTITIVTPSTYGMRMKSQHIRNLSLFCHYLQGILDDLADVHYMMDMGMAKIFQHKLQTEEKECIAGTAAMYGHLQCLDGELKRLFPDLLI